jgi:hypothetical protein
MAEPTLDQVGQWILDNQDKKGTPDYVSMANAYRDLSTRQAAPAPPISSDNAPTRTTVRPDAPQIDFNRPIDQVRKDITAIQDPGLRKQAYDAWGDQYVANEQKNAGWGTIINNAVRSVARGVPGGTFLDELTALTGSAPYEETLAYQRALDRAYAKQHPAANIAGNVAGGVAAAPLTMLRGAGWLGNAGINTLIGATQGAGEREGDLADRAGGAGWGGAFAAGTSALLGPLAAYGQRWSRTTPEVDRAASDLNVPLPFFARAQDPVAQAQGRQFAQTNPGSRVAAAWNAAREGTDQAGGRIVQGITGAPRELAPNVAGTAMQGGMENAVENATQRIQGLARANEGMMPPGYRGDPSGMRQQLQQIIDERVARQAINPHQGLANEMNFATAPRGVPWPGVAGKVTELGEELGRPNIMPRDVSGGETARLYGALRGDQGRMVEEQLGPAARATFEGRVAQQRELADLRRSITGAIGSRQPEQLVNLAHDAATLTGGGTRLNQLQLITQNMNPAERAQLGAGVLAKIQNDAKGVASGIAAKIAAIPQAARDVLWPPGSQIARDVGNLSTVAGRVGAVDAMQHVGSAKTLGNTIASNVPLAVAGYLAHQVGHGIAAGAAYGGGLAANHFIKPYLMRQGLPQWLTNAVNAGGMGVSRTAGMINTPP